MVISIAIFSIYEQILRKIKLTLFKYEMKINITNISLMLMKICKSAISKTYQDSINKTSVFAKYRLIFNGITNTHFGPLTINISNYVV